MTNDDWLAQTLRQQLDDELAPVHSSVRSRAALERRIAGRTRQVPVRHRLLRATATPLAVAAVVTAVLSAGSILQSGSQARDLWPAGQPGQPLPTVTAAPRPVSSGTPSAVAPAGAERIPRTLGTARGTLVPATASRAITPGGSPVALPAPT